MEKLKKLFTGFGKNTEKQETHSCCCENGHHHHETGSSHSEAGYYCPMKCEGDKIYNAPGKCPVCNMHLLPVN